MITCGTQIVSGSTGGGGASAPAGTGVVTVSGGAFVDPVASAATTRATLDAQQDVLTTRGDLVRAGVSGVAERLPLGTATHVLTSDGTDAAWAAPAGGAPSGAAGGDLGGSYPAPTVTDLTIASEARGDLLRRGASAWQRVAAKTAGNLVGGDGTDVVSLTPAVAAPPLAFANGHTQPDAAAGFLWYFNETAGPILNYGSVGSDADLTASAGATQGALYLASLNGRGIDLPATANSDASGGAGELLGVLTGITFWCVFTVTVSLGGRSRGTVVMRTSHVPWADPYNTLAIAVTNGGAIVTQIGKSSGGYTEHVTSATYTVGTQVLFGFSINGTAWTTYRNGVLTNTYSDAGDVNWGDGTGVWIAGDNGAGDSKAPVHVTEWGCSSEVWTSDQWIAAEQRRLGRWHG